MAIRKNTDLRLKRIGLNIRAQREALQLTQEWLAEKADLHDRTVGKIERGELNFSVLICLRLCKALNISSEKLLAGARD